MIELGLPLLLLLILGGPRALEALLARVERGAQGAVRRLGPWAWSLLVGFLALLLAAAYVRPAMETAGLGASYAELARAPFASQQNAVSHRLLTPLLSYALGLRGEAILLTNLLITLGLLTYVHRHFLASTGRAMDALLATLFVASSLVVLATVHYGGYCDALSWLLIFALWTQRRRAALVIALYFLALWNKESVAFLLPWIVFVGARSAPLRVRRGAVLLLGLLLVTALYLWMRGRLTAGQDISFSLHYYFGPLQLDAAYWLRRSFGHWNLGLFSVYRALWLVPLYWVGAAWRQGDRQPLVHAVLLLGGAYAQLAIAYDASRMLTLGFMLGLVALEQLLQREDAWLRRGLAALLAVNLFVPPLFTAAHQIELMHSPLGAWIQGML